MRSFTPESASILIAMLVATVGLLIYVRFVLPKQIESRFRDSLKGFSTAIELRFPSHQGLTSRVVPLSLALGRTIHLDGSSLRNLETAAQLRDIGLCAIPFSLINNKPAHKWDDADHQTYWRHPEVAAAMLELIPSLRGVANMVRNHHASYDGSHGPFFSAGDNIPIESRILCIVTEYVWLERSVGHLLACDALKSGRGTRFDPFLVDQFFTVLTSPREVETREPVASVA